MKQGTSIQPHKSYLFRLHMIKVVNNEEEGKLARELNLIASRPQAHWQSRELELEDRHWQTVRFSSSRTSTSESWLHSKRTFFKTAVKNVEA